MKALIINMGSKIMEKLEGKSMNIVAENISKMKELFPEVFCEDKIDFERLQEVLGEYTDDKEERYSFNWKGKSKAIRIAQTPSTGTLRPAKEESKNFDTTENLYIEGDNLEVLKLLQKTYHSKVKMIYIDPPYNTGSDLVYPDDFKDNIKNYLEITGQVDADGSKIGTNSESSGRYHTDWLNMMYPRLKLARNLLSDDGVIFISISQDELQNLLKICDEIFGEDNRVGICSRVMKTGGNKGQYFSPNIEYVLVYAKSIINLSVFREKISDELISKVYNLQETQGERKGEMYRIMGLCQPGLDVRPNQRYWIECPDGSYVIPTGSTYPTEIANGEKVLPSDDDNVWKWTFERYQKELNNNNIVFKETKTSSLLDQNRKQSKWNIYNKIWLNDRLEEGRVPVDLISKYENRHSSQELKELNIPFDFAKPSDLIAYLISIVNENNNAIILDFFSGSATTAHSVIKLNIEDKGNRKFIMVQLPEPTYEKSEAYKAGYKTICEIGKERIRRAGEKILEENKDKEGIENLDVGFKVFKLDSSNIKKWDVDADNLEINMDNMIDNFVPNRTEEDIVYEIMLKYGIDLTYPVEMRKIEGKKVFSIGFGALFICLDDEITLNVVEGIVRFKDDLNPEITRVVFKDNGFKNDSVKTNAIQILRRNKIEEIMSI